jgi:hypothetical protein
VLNLNNQIPPVVNGSNIPEPLSIPYWQANVSEDSENQSIDTDISHSWGAGSDLSIDGNFPGQLTPRDIRSDNRVEPPTMVNGSSSRNTEAFPSFTSPPVVNGASPRQLITPNELMHGEQTNGSLRLSPASRNRLTRQAQNGGMSPLDIGVGQDDPHREDLQHLSPVYETRTPSPTANRKFEPGLDRKSSTGTVVRAKINKPETPKSISKLGPANGNHIKQAPSPSEQKPNGHTRGSKSEGNGLGSQGWQKSVSKNKKKAASSDMKSSGAGQPHSEKLPNDDSERKGG